MIQNFDAVIMVVSFTLRDRVTIINYVLGLYALEGYNKGYVDQTGLTVFDNHLYIYTKFY